ncbi:MAG: hypothetical protein QG673_2065 [Pseudomonadota bacterium]|nr:hypothetical protein [Pseudomonadota bacterium]
MRKLIFWVFFTVISIINADIAMASVANTLSTKVSNKNVLRLPTNNILMPNGAVNMFINPLTNEPELPVFNLNGRTSSFAGKIATVISDKMQLESRALTYIPLYNNFLPNSCSYNNDGSFLCFKSHSLDLNDNKITYQMTTDNRKNVSKEIDIGIMGASLKFFTAVFESYGDTSSGSAKLLKYIGISNDNFNQRVVLIECRDNAKCNKTKLGVKPAPTDVKFQIINNKLYFIAGDENDKIMQIDLISDEYNVKTLNLANVHAFSVDKSGNIYLITPLNDKSAKPGSFIIAKCLMSSGKCQAIYSEKAYGAQYDTSFVGVDEKWIYLVANNINPKTNATTVVLLRVPKL